MNKGVFVSTMFQLTYAVDWRPDVLSVPHDQDQLIFYRPSRTALWFHVVPVVAVHLLHGALLSRATRISTPSGGRGWRHRYVTWEDGGVS